MLQHLSKMLSAVLILFIMMTADTVLWVKSTHDVHLGLLWVEDVRAVVGALVRVWLVWLIFALLWRDYHS